MILRKPSPQPDGKARSAWSAFAETQQNHTPPAGYVSQPAHAALAGRLAAALTPDLFGHLPEDVIEAVARHDTGWAGPDLAALECAAGTEPIGFLTYPPEKAVLAWKRSIDEAEGRSALQGVLVSRHFCTLAPRDEHPAHEAFRREENLRRTLLETDFRAEDLQRWTAALGFCDLVSLCLSAGMQGRFELPVAHPADPQAAEMPKVALAIDGGRIQLETGLPPDSNEIYLDGWERSGTHAVSCCRWTWHVGPTCISVRDDIRPGH